MAEGKEEDTSAEEKEPHVQDVVDVHGVADLARLSLLSFILFVRGLFGLREKFIFILNLYNTLSSSFNQFQWGSEYRTFE